MSILKNNLMLRTLFHWRDTIGNKEQCFDKPIWTLAEMAGVFPGLLKHIGRIAPTVRDRPITQTFREQLMLAVASENGCWYCQSVHTIFSKMLNIPEEEIASIIEGKDEVGGPAEREALAYVRDLARRDFKSRDEDLRAKLSLHFTVDELEGIESAAHVMNFANRIGNTFDKLLARSGNRCSTSSAPMLDMALLSGLFIAAAAVMGPLVTALEAAN